MNYIDPLGLWTWPYSWQGWGGLVLTGVGGILIVTPEAGTTVLGWWMVAGGTALSFADLHSGMQSAFETGEDVLDKIKDHNEQLDELLDELDDQIEEEVCPNK